MVPRYHVTILHSARSSRGYCFSTLFDRPLFKLDTVHWHRHLNTTMVDGSHRKRKRRTPPRSSNKTVISSGHGRSDGTPSPIGTADIPVQSRIQNPKALPLSNETPKRTPRPADGKSARFGKHRVRDIESESSEQDSESETEETVSIQIIIPKTKRRELSLALGKVKDLGRHSLPENISIP